MLLSTFLALALLMTPTQSPGVLEGGGIVHDDQASAMIHAPKGWIFDERSGVDEGLGTVLYPQGSTWAEATTVMYLNFGRLESGDTLEHFIEVDLAKFREQSPAVASSPGEPIPVERVGPAQVRYFTGDTWGNSEAVAYLEYQSSIILYVLSSRNRADFQKSLPAFRQMVASSTPMGVTQERK